MIRLTCPNCDRKLSVEDMHAGKVGKCPACQGTISVPGASQSRASSGPGRAEDDPLPATRRVPKPKPGRPAQLAPPTKKEPADEREPIGDDMPAPSRRPAREPITRAPVARPRPRLTAEEDLSREEEVEELEEIEELEEVEEVEPSRKKQKRKKKRRRDSGVGVTAGLMVAILGAVLLWVVLTPLAFFFKPVAIAMLIVGAVLGLLGRGSFLRIAREEGGATHLLVLLVPFYEVYFFLSRINKTLLPFLVWMCGVVFLFSGCITLLIHHEHQEYGEDRPAPALAGTTPQEVDARCSRLLAGPTKEARAWLREQGAGGNAEGIAEAARLVEQAYQAGAKQVIAADVHRDEDGDLVATFIIVLPDDAATRQRVFDWHRGEHGPDDEKDVGQKYLVFEPF